MSGIIQYFVLLWLIYSTETAAWAESLGNSHVRESVSLWDPSGMERLGSLGTAVPRTHFSKTVIEGSVPGRGKHARASFHTCPSLDSSWFFPGTNALIGRIEKAILKSCSVGSKLKWMKTCRELASLNRKHSTRSSCVRGAVLLIPLQLPSRTFRVASSLPSVLRESGQARTGLFGSSGALGLPNSMLFLPISQASKCAWRVQLLALQFTSCENMGDSLPFSGSHFSYV